MKITTGSDFSGVGAFDHAIESLCEKHGITHKRIFACDMDKSARKAYIANHGEPDYYPENVYDREIPSESLDIYMTSPPCQAFSIAGKRAGKEDERGILFFNSHEFIEKNKPRFFIFENVKGLISHDSGRTFQEWTLYLGGKSVNGVKPFFAHDRAVPYHIYYTVINSKEHGVPQNRERVFIVGIRDDADNVFQWPRAEPLTKLLRDVLETFETSRFETREEFDKHMSKYYLSEKQVQRLIKQMDDKKNGFAVNDVTGLDVCPTLISGGTSPKDKQPIIRVAGNVNPSGNGMNGNVYDCDGISPKLSTNKGEGIKVVQRGRGKNQGGLHDICPTITTNSFEQNNHLCIPVLTPDRPEKRQNRRRFKENNDPSFTLTTQDRHGIFDGYTIRRLTPLECFRLMGFPDKHTQRCREAGISDSQLYKQAGNSIVVDVLEAILGQLPIFKTNQNNNP